MPPFMVEIAVCIFKRLICENNVKFRKNKSLETQETSQKQLIYHKRIFFVKIAEIKFFSVKHFHHDIFSKMLKNAIFCHWPIKISDHKTQIRKACLKLA